MKIQVVEANTGLDRATIRFYESEGLIVPVRQDNGYRMYSVDDIQCLQKIKLLRQLGIPLFRIKSLQNGSDDMSAVLEQQIKLLENKIEDSARAKFVCTEMKNAGVAYDNLDAERYLGMFREPNNCISKEFHEPVQKESHPFRRFFARCIDLALTTTILSFIIVSIFRVRPYGDVLQTVACYLSFFMFIPLEALMLNLWSTTPGKWLMGIRVENANGGKLSYTDAFSRSFSVVKFGYLFFLPILSIWALYRNYRADRAGERSDWDENSDILYKPQKTLHKITVAVTVVLVLLLKFFVILDSYRPPISSNELTVEEFAKNYRICEQILGHSSEYDINKNGTWEKRQPKDSQYDLFVNGNGHNRQNFEYICDREGNIQSIHYKQRWDAYFGFVLPDHCATAIYTLVTSAAEFNANVLFELFNWLDSGYKNMFNSLNTDDPIISGNVSLSNVNIQWIITHSEHAYIINGTLIPVNTAEDVPLWYQLDLTITIE